MANNITVKDASGNDVVIAYEDISDVLFQKNILHDDNGNAVGVTNGALDVMLQDQYTRPIEVFFARYIKSVLLESSMGAITLATKAFTIDDTTSIDVGDLLNIDEDGVHYEGVITNINAGTGVLTCDRESNYAFSFDATSSITKKGLNVNGSSTERVFRVQPPENAKWDITKIVLFFVGARAMDDSMFASLTALTNGCILRSYYDYSGGAPTRAHNYFNAKTNLEIGLSFNSTQYDDRASGSGFYGFKAVKTFSGQENNGVTVRLDGSQGDNIQLVVRDDLTEITSFYIVAHGHTVE